MADCWSCGAERGDAGFCTTCQKIQPVSPQATHFQVLSLPTKMRTARKALDQAFRDLSKKVHPDRFGDHSSIERKLALEHTTRLNEAHRVLKDPQSRAEYMLSLTGVDVPGEESRTTDNAFLMEMLELQEEVDETKDEAILEEHRRTIQARYDGELSRLTSYIDNNEGQRANAEQAVEVLRYLRRLLERIEARLEGC